MKNLPKPNCTLCKKPIKGKIFFQGGMSTHPVHKDCRIEIKARKKYGGGI